MIKLVVFIAVLPSNDEGNLTPPLVMSETKKAQNIINNRPILDS